MMKESEKDYRQSSKSDCWYKDVCNLNCTGCLRYIEMRYLVDNSGIPKSKQYPIELDAGVDYDAYVELADIKNSIVEFVENSRNLLIISKHTGNGKTTWAIKLMMKYFNEVWAGNGFKVRGMFVHVPTLLSQLKNFDNPLSEEYKQNLMECDLVVWDDIASMELSKYDYAQLLLYVDHRLFTDKANIFTSNRTTAQAFEDAIGSKLASRIWHTSEIVEFKSKDRRG